MLEQSLGDRISIYCDESCHLENDIEKVMLLGCIWAPSKRNMYFKSKLNELKKTHHVLGELKWTKVSPKNLEFYLELVDVFFSEPELGFRALVIPDKSALDHATFNGGSHDSFYYKMYFWLLTKIVSPNCVYEIFLDVKDTRSRFKVRELRKVLCFDKYDFAGKMITQLRSVRSHEIQLMQLTDFLLGAVSYRHRGLKTSAAKLAVIERIEKHLNRSLLIGTRPSEEKFNIFIWKPRQH